jgi:hypothetical protein
VFGPAAEFVAGDAAGGEAAADAQGAAVAAAGDRAGDEAAAHGPGVAVAAAGDQAPANEEDAAVATAAGDRTGGTPA